MKKNIGTANDLTKIRSDLQSKGKHIVRYEDIERNVNGFLYGPAKLTPTILSDLNNLVEGIVLDSCIEMDLSEQQINFGSPLTEALLDLSDYILDIDLEADFDADDLIDPIIIQSQIEILQNLFRLFQSGQISKYHAERFKEVLEPLLKKSELIGEIVSLVPLLERGEWAEYFSKLNKLVENVDAFPDLNNDITSLFEDIGVLSGLYDLEKRSDELEEGLLVLSSGSVYDPIFNMAKSASIAYQQYFGKKRMSIRLPAQLRYPLLNGLNTHKVTYEIYSQIAHTHQVTIELLIKYGGAIRIYIPPLLSILLSRCDNLDDFPKRLMDMRGDFENIRSSIELYYSTLNESKSLKEQLEITRELCESIDLLKKKFTDLRSSVIYQTWHVVKEGSPLKIFTGTLDLLVEKDKQNKILRYLQPFADLWTSSLNVKEYGKLFENVFGENLIDYKAFEKSAQLENSYGALFQEPQKKE